VSAWVDHLPPLQGGSGNIFSAAAVTSGCRPWSTTYRPFMVGLEAFFGGGGDIGCRPGSATYRPFRVGLETFFGGGDIGCRPGSTTYRPFGVGLETFFGGGGDVGCRPGSTAHRLVYHLPPLQGGSGSAQTPTSPPPMVDPGRHPMLPPPINVSRPTMQGR